MDDGTEDRVAGGSPGEAVTGAADTGVGALVPVRKRRTVWRKERDAAGQVLRTGGLTKAKRAHFLSVLGKTGSVKKAAAAAGAVPGAFYLLRKRDADFAADWADAVRQGHAELEAALLARARGTADADDRLDTALAMNLLKRMDTLVAGGQPRQGRFARSLPFAAVCDELLRRIAVVAERLERGRR